MNLQTASLTQIQRAYVHAAIAATHGLGDAETCLLLAHREILARARQERLVAIARAWTGDASVDTCRETDTERRMKALTGRPAWDSSATG